MKARKTVKSLCSDSDRKYYRVVNSPLQLSADAYLVKVQIAKKGVRIEDNRIVFELSDTQIQDLEAIIALLKR